MRCKEDVGDEFGRIRSSSNEISADMEPQQQNNVQKTQIRFEGPAMDGFNRGSKEIQILSFQQSTINSNMREQN